MSRTIQCLRLLIYKSFLRSTILHHDGSSFRLQDCGCSPPGDFRWELLPLRLWTSTSGLGGRVESLHLLLRIISKLSDLTTRQGSHSMQRFINSEGGAIQYQYGVDSTVGAKLAMHGGIARTRVPSVCKCGSLFCLLLSQEE